MALSSPSTAQWASSLRNPITSPQQHQGLDSSTSFRIPGPSTRFHKEHKPSVVHHELRPRPTRFATDSAAPPTQSRLSGSTSPNSASPSPSTAFPSRSTASPSSIPLPVRPEHNRRKSTPQSYFMPHHAPLTPVRSHHPTTADFADSPCSDYYTDENRSVDDQSSSRLSPCPPSSHSQKLLLRLNTLGAEILRQDPTASHAITNITAKLDDLEAALRTPNARSSEDYSSRPSTPQTPLSSSTEKLPPAIQTRLRIQERTIEEANDVLRRVTQANESLRKRCTEIRQLHVSAAQELEHCSTQYMQLKAENDSLKADLAFDHSELLFMKLQLKALEVEADAAFAHMAAESGIGPKRVLLDEDIQRWKSDWDDVDARLRSRRSRHSVVSTTPENMSATAREAPPTESHGSWLIETCEKRQGRVQTITVKRFDPSSANGHDENGGESLTDGSHGQSPAGYLAHATQTSEPFLTRSEWIEIVESLDSEKDNSPDYTAGEADLEGADQDPSSDSDDEPASKTPWRELCDSLAAFAGMDRD